MIWGRMRVGGKAAYFLFENLLLCFILLFKFIFICVGEGRLELRSPVSILDMLTLKYLVDI